LGGFFTKRCALLARASRAADAPQVRGSSFEDRSGVRGTRADQPDDAADRESRRWWSPRCVQGM